MARIWIEAIAAAGCLVVASGIAWAQDYPSRPIRFLQPFPPGGAVDTVSRLVGERLSSRVGQQVVIDNRSGANGAIAVNLITLSAPDGYTMMAVAQSFLTHQSVYADFKHDLRKDVTPVILGAKFPLVLVVHASVQARSVKELINLAKSGGLSYGDNGGIGSSGHIATELFKQQSGVEITHIPYKGAAPMYVDLLGGQVQLAFAHITSVRPHVASGRVRALATTATTRLPVLPDVPTTAEAGFASVNVTEVWGVIGPAGMPQSAVKKLNAEIADILKAPPIFDRLTGEGAQVVATSPAEFGVFIKAEIPKIGDVLRRAGIKPGNF